MILVVALLLAGVGTALLVLGFIELRPSRMFLQRPTSPARALRAGPVEAAGVLRADGVQPIVSGFGVPCVIVHTLYEKRVGRNAYREESRDTVSVPCVLSDASGSCTVELSHVDLMGERWEVRHEDGRRVTQVVIREGASVFVAGDAKPIAGTVSQDYRANVPKLAIGPSGDAPLLVSIGSQSSAVWGYGWRAMVSVVCGVAMLVFAVVATLVHVALP